ncbi:SpoIVB peptidase S55 domain-containing protein [Nocardioides lianchengensis]|uniref:SpoIVB peptidase S55 n=1 Tax=Nocardioides lianchengensis TaxID=1045774 RepID=A0A1G7BDA8_9ACTN|nr:SpoIVB peptidase S55 domain-containing protein [Nocardioides lianchengensis]NYG10043.1 hypothetical protein [Nocardioides lianchengensis]SDE24215.1 SpoIVB peptidase S55 [Nocardioides lianchengensis]
MSLIHRRHRMVSLATVAALALGLPAVGSSLGSPAQAADPTADCKQAFPVDELAAEDEVTGLTVTRGTTPVGFTGTVLGVLEDGIAPDVDMIMVDVEMPEFTRTGGIWQGMSGSPVYAQDGRLIGAVAYGLSAGPSPIAGVTPFEDMDDYLAATPASRVPLRGAAARKVAATAGISTAKAAQGFRELPMPLGVSGLSARRLAQLQTKGPAFLDKSTYLLGRASAQAAGPETLVAGGNLGVSAAYGDVALAGVGTVTSVCNGRVVGFGHPMVLLGATTMGLHPADAIYVQPDSLGSPFKVANLAPAVGTITDDRTTGVTGTFGAPPSAATITSTVTYGTRARTGRTAVSVPDFLAEASLYQLIANQDRVIDGPAKGTSLLTWRITGTEGSKPFALAFTDRFTSTDLGLEAHMGVAELVYSLGQLDGVKITSVSAKAAVTNDLRRHAISAVEQKRGGQWVKITRRSPAFGRAGKSIRLRVVVGGRAGKQVLPLKPIKLPKRSPGLLMLVAQGGDGAYTDTSGSSVAKVRTALAAQVRHDQVQVQVGTPNKMDFGGEEEEYLMGRRKVSFVRTQKTAPLGHVVSGMKMLTVLVG